MGYWRNQVDEIDVNCSDKYIGVSYPSNYLKIPFYDVNEIMVFQSRISIQYKKSSVATYRGSEDEILIKAHELRKSKLPIRNSNQGGI